MRYSSRCAALVFFGFSAAFAQAGDLPVRFTLGRYIPADTWMFVHGVHNPERAWIDQEWGEVWDALKQSGVHNDILEMVMSMVGTEQRVEAEAHISKVSQLLAGVRWGDLLGQEVVFARGLSLPILDPMLLARGASDSAEANTKGLVAILEYLASFSEAVSVETLQIHGVDVWSLGVEAGDLPIAVELFRKGEVIGMTTSRETTTNILALMAGAGTTKAIVDSGRFKKALAEVQSPEDSVMFFDYKMFLEGIDRLMNLALAEADHHSEDTEAVRKAVGKAISLCNFGDYVITTMETDGRRELTHTVARMQPNKMDSPLARCFLDRQPFQRFDTYIPVDATGFSLTGFADLGILYRTVLDFIVQNIPEGVGLIEKWNAFLAEVGFDPQRDLFSWLSWEMISVDMPAAVVTPMSGSDSVFMVRVKDAKLANEKINTAIAWANSRLEPSGQMLVVEPAPVGAEGFRVVTHPMMAMMMLRPVIGVKDDWLMIGTSAGPIRKCLDVAAGKAPSILKNERFKREGLVVSGPVMSASFTDMSKLGEELTSAVGMAGMVFGFATMGIPDTPETRDAKQVISKLLGIAMKLGPALRKIDFYSSSSSVTTRDGAVLRTEKVTTYKPPKPKPAQTAEPASSVNQTMRSGDYRPVVFPKKTPVAISPGGF